MIRLRCCGLDMIKMEKTADTYPDYNNKIIFMMDYMCVDCSKTVRLVLSDEILVHKLFRELL